MAQYLVSSMWEVCVYIRIIMQIDPRLIISLVLTNYVTQLWE